MGTIPRVANCIAIAVMSNSNASTLAIPACAGRFAPSPSGPLHFGSLVAALASFLDARAIGARWLVRMEDLDPPRQQPGAAEAILDALVRLGLEWDGTVVYQSQRLGAYARAAQELKRVGLAFDCGCTRKQALRGPRGLEGPIYSGTCRQGLNGKAPRSLRLRVDEAAVVFDDLFAGRQGQQLERDVGDFVLRRADGHFAYQLAVVVDDAWQNVTHVIRGADLLTSTPRQIHLQRCLGLATPEYGHIPLVLDAGGEKLSKSSQAPELDLSRPAAELTRALEFLGQTPPVDLASATRASILDWGIEHWRRDGVRQRVN